MAKSPRCCCVALRLSVSLSVNQRSGAPGSFPLGYSLALGWKGDLSSFSPFRKFGMGVFQEASRLEKQLIGLIRPPTPHDSREESLQGSQEAGKVDPEGAFEPSHPH